MKKVLHLLALATLLAQTAQAGNLSSLGTLTQAELRTASEDLGAALSYKPLLPTEDQGITGFDIGVAVTGTDVSRSAAALSKAGASLGSLDTLLTTRLNLHKGLPLGFDIGAFVASVPSLGTTVTGGELRYALLKGGVATPAIGVRGALTRMSGSDQLALSTRSLDISISKGFAMLTPYVGAGQVWVNSSPNAGSLAGESFNQGKLFAGASMSLGLLNLTFEGDKTGNTTSWGVKLGLRW